MRNGPYLLEVAPADYPGKKYRGKYAYGHHLAWWRLTGAAVPAGFVVHHKNEDKHDNSAENLELKTVGAHNAEHTRSRKQADVAVVCATCKIGFSVLARNYKVKTRAGQKNFYCCRQHQHESLRTRSSSGGAIGR